jgi:hypothetical protein
MPMAPGTRISEGPYRNGDDEWQAFANTINCGTTKRTEPKYNPRAVVRLRCPFARNTD